MGATGTARACTLKALTTQVLATVLDHSAGVGIRNVGCSGSSQDQALAGSWSASKARSRRVGATVVLARSLGSAAISNFETPRNAPAPAQVLTKFLWLPHGNLLNVKNNISQHGLQAPRD